MKQPVDLEAGVVYVRPSPHNQGKKQQPLPKHLKIYIYIGVSKNSGTPKSSSLIGFSIINHPFWGTPIFGNTHIYIYIF